MAADLILRRARGKWEVHGMHGNGRQEDDGAFYEKLRRLIDGDGGNG